MAVTTTNDGQGNYTITIVIPAPDIGLAELLAKFPPNIPVKKLPAFPKALAALGKRLQSLLGTVNKLLKMIPDGSARLIVKVGSATIFDEVVDTNPLV